nr:MAG TPA: hypothetical protein [Caudoviricetes sp.]
MKYKNEDDNRYRVRFMYETKQLMDKLTVKEFISYLEANAEFKDYVYDYIHIGEKRFRVKCYDLQEEDTILHNEFAVTEDGRVFHSVSFNCHVELVDSEKIQSSKANQKKHTEPFRVTIFPNQNGKKDFYFNSYAEAMAFAKAKVNNHIVFLLEHMIDGMYNIVTEVTNEN